MKIRKDKDILRFIGIGLGLVLLGGIMLIFQLPSRPIGSLGLGLILTGVIMFVVASYVATKPKTELIMDERTEKINEKAGYSAFWIVLLSMAILFWADIIWSLGLELKDVYYTTILVGIYSWGILRWYYNKRSEI